MADIVNIAQFDFDSTRVEKHLEDLQKRLFDLTKQQKELDEQYKKSKQTHEDNIKDLAHQNREMSRLNDMFKKSNPIYLRTSKQMKKLSEAGLEATDVFRKLGNEQDDAFDKFKRDNQEYQKATNAINEIEKSLTKLTKSEENHFKTTKNLQIERSKVNEEYNKTVAIYKIVLDRNGQITSSSEALTNALEREVKTREEAKRSTIELNKIKDQLNLNDKEQVKILDVINQKVDKNNKLLKDSGSQNEKLKANIGNYTNSIKEAAEELDIFNGGLLGFIERAQTAGGVGNLLTQTFSKITTATYNLAKSFISLAFTPIGILLTALAGIAYVTKEWYDYNMEIAKTDKLIRGITKTSKEVTAEIRVMANAIQETFGTPLQESVETAKVLVNEFGITYEEALNQIAEGLIRGQEGNKEYMQSLKEYSTFFAQAGYSVEEFRSIVSAGYDLGMYKDKLPDAIKEFSLSIREQTKATRDALVNAFGQSFSNELLKGVENGSIGVNEALKKISDEAKKSNLDIQQQAQLTADLFKGAGEDAGGALKIFQAITKSHEDQNRALTDLEKSTTRLFEAQRQFGIAKDAALSTDGIIDLRKEFDIFWLRVKRDFYLAIRFMKDQLEYAGTFLIVFLQTFKQSFGEVVRIINEFDISNPIKSLAEFISLNKKFGDQVVETTKRIYAQKKAQNEAVASIKLLEDTVKNVTDKNIGRREKDAKDAEAARKKQEALEKAAHDALMKRIDVEIAKRREQLELFITQQGDRARTLQEQLELEESTSKKSIEILDFELKSKKISQEKYDTEVLKLKQRSAKLIAQIAVKSAELELENSIQTNKSILENGRLLTQETLKQEMERLKLIADARKSFEKTQYDQGLIDLDEYNKRVRQIDIQYLEDDKSLKKTYTDQQRATDELNRSLQAESDINALKLKLSNEAEVKRVQAEFERNDEIIKLDQQRIDGLISEENYQIALNNIRGRYAITTKQIDEEVLKARLDLTKQVFSGIAEAVGEQTALGKAAGIATASVNTYQGASEVIKSPAVFPEPYNTILKALQVTATIGMGLNTVKNISKVKVPSAPKGYATGGVITDGFGIKRSNGDNVLITAKTGEAILNQQQQSFIGRDLLSLAGVPGFATGGLVGTKPSSLASVQNSIFPQIDFTALTEAVRQGALEGSQQGSLVGSQQGTTVGSQQGISQLGSQRVMQGNSVN